MVFSYIIDVLLGTHGVKSPCKPKLGIDAQLRFNIFVIGHSVQKVKRVHLFMENLTLNFVFVQ